MGWLVSIAISNAIVATLLGVLAYVICRKTKSTSFAHLLWVLVLLKLVTPPLFGIPLPVLPEWAETDNNPSVAMASIKKGELANDSMLLEQSTIAVDSVGTLDSAGSTTLSTNTEKQTSISGQKTIFGLPPWILGTWLAGAVLFAFYQIYAVSYTHLRAHETRGNLVCRLLLEKKK